MRYPPFSALANVLVRSEKQEDALAMSAELGRLLDPAPEGVKVMGPAEAPVPKLKSEFRYQLLLKAVNRKRLNEVLRDIQRFAYDRKWRSTALVIDVDPLTLL
jgi:primosomal protein N' (replication factor Y) (superfamily II helicase)